MYLKITVEKRFKTQLLCLQLQRKQRLRQHILNAQTMNAETPVKDPVVDDVKKGVHP